MLANRRLLVMEDSLEDIQMIKRHTSSLQLEMKSARTIDEGLELLRTEPFDFLLSDLHIESIVGVDIPDGFRLISEALELQPNLTVLAMSTDPRADIWQSAKEAGAQHFIRKPILR
ncbi:MAG: response regulator, partial [Proteobacteria bacterium]